VSTQAKSSPADAQFVDAVLSVQSLVSAGAPAQETYQAIIDEAVRLLDGDSGALRLVDHEDPPWSVAVAARNPRGQAERWRQRAPLSEG
jgi:hypothetical protein